jgi:hypothetical protein
MSEPQHIKEILPDVMADIEKRMKLNRQKKVLSTVADYYQNHWQGRPRGRRRVNGNQTGLLDKVFFKPMKKIFVLSKIMLDKAQV